MSVDYEDYEEPLGTNITDPEPELQYKTFLLQQMVEVTQWHEAIYSQIISGDFDRETFVGYCSKLISLYMHLTPKVKSLKDNAGLKKRWRKYQDWQYTPWLPLKNQANMDMLPDLFILIREAFEELGVTVWRKQ